MGQRDQHGYDPHARPDLPPSTAARATCVLDLRRQGPRATLVGTRDGQVFACAGFVKEDTGAFKCDINIERCPRQVRRVTFGANLDGFAVNDQVVAFGFDFVGKNAMNGIIFQKMCVGVDVTQVVDGNNFNVGATAFNDRTQNKTADTTKTINT